jgi:dihydrofolate reductase
MSPSPIEFNCTAIVATGLDNAIGQNGRMPWHLPEDLRFFKEHTTDHPLVMGRKTFESLGRVLPGRPHIVITRMTNKEFKFRTQTIPNPTNEKVWSVSSFEELKFLAGSETFLKSLTEQQSLALSGAQSNGFFVIGGAEIYAMALGHRAVKRVLQTEIQSLFPDADTFFPKLDPEIWKLEEETELLVSKNGLTYKFKSLLFGK